MPENYRLALYTDKDRDALRRFFVRSSKGKRAVAENLMRSIGPSSIVTVAKQDNEIIGMSHCYPVQHGAIHFHAANVLQEHRGLGIFTALLQHVLKQAGGKEVTAHIRPERDHYKTMIRAGFQFDQKLDSGQVQIKRPRQKLLGFF